MKLKKEVLIILLIQITEVLGFSLILPFLPYLAQDLGATPFTVGLILTSFSLLQLVSAPIMGRLSDRFGRKPLLLVSQLATALSFFILAFAKSLPLIFLSRFVDGAFGSNFTIGQAVLSDLSTKKDRSLIFGIGGMAGMYCGALCQKYVPAKAIKWMLAGIILFTAAGYVAAFVGY